MTNLAINQNQAVQPIDQNIISSLVLNGDLSKMTPMQRVEFYGKMCDSLGLNPMTQPFQILKLQGKEILYATKSCTEQLRKLHGVSVTSIKTERFEDVFVVTANVQDKDSRTDAATGAVTIGNLKGDALANALMKAETKAKRRATLSICGLGMLDESEIETIPNAQVVQATEVKEQPKQDNKAIQAQRALIAGLLDSRAFDNAKRGKALANIEKASLADLKKWEANIQAEIKKVEANGVSAGQMEYMEELLDNELFLEDEKKAARDTMISKSFHEAEQFLSYLEEVKANKMADAMEVENHKGAA
jgi:hypothetical protein